MWAVNSHPHSVVNLGVIKNYYVQTEQIPFVLYLKTRIADLLLMVGHTAAYYHSTGVTEKHHKAEAPDKQPNAPMVVHSTGRMPFRNA